MTANGHRLGALTLVLAGLWIGASRALIAAPQAIAAPQTQAPATTGRATTPAPATGGFDQPASNPGQTDRASEQADRVRRALDQESSVNFDSSQFRFYLQVVARPPVTFAEYAKGSDLMFAPTKRGNPMSHQEFLRMVTPRELYSSGGITPAELLQFALTNWVGQTLVRRGLEEIKEARTEREKQEIRDRIDRELAILRANEGSSR